MKNTINKLGIIACVAVIGCTMTACDTDGNGDGKLAGAAVNAPTATTNITEISITIAAVTAPTNGQTVEYARNTSNTAPSLWQEELEFTGLTADTQYYIFARSAENDTHRAGTPSAGFPVKTSPDSTKAAGAAVNAPTATTSVTATSITIAAVTAPGSGQTVEYARNTTNTAPTSGWQSGLTFSGLTASTTYYIFARSASNAGHNTGSASTGFQVTTLASSGGGSGVNTLTLNAEEVYEISWDDVNETIEFTLFTGNDTVTAVYFDYGNDLTTPLGGTGTITGGQLSFTIGVPNHMVPIGELIATGMGGMGDSIDFVISNSSVQAVSLDLITDLNGQLGRWYQTDTVQDFLLYIFVTSDVTVSAEKTVFQDGKFEDTINAINLNLKAGWNPIHQKAEKTGDASQSLTISLADPDHLIWVFFPDYAVDPDPDPGPGGP